MARPKGSTNKVPKYCHHRASGQAYVTLGGQMKYLGVHGSPESYERYHRECAEFKQRGRMRRGGDTDPLTITELAAAYWNHTCEVSPERDPRSMCNREHHVRQRRKAALIVLRELYGTMLVSDFNAFCLETLRDRLPFRQSRATGRDKKGETWTRRKCNSVLGNIKQVFAWGVRRGLVPDKVFTSVETVEPLPYGVGRTTPPRQPADEYDVWQLIDAATPTLKAMLTVHWFTGMRPSELCLMRPVDIDMAASPDYWIYTPQYHKTDNRGSVRQVALGSKCQEALMSIMPLNATAYIFTPRNTIEETLQRMRSEREERIRSSTPPARNGAALHGSETRWERARQEYLSMHSECPCGKPAVFVSNIVSRGDDPAREYDVSNMRGLCRKCHYAEIRSRRKHPNAIPTLEGYLRRMKIRDRYDSGAYYGAVKRLCDHVAAQAEAEGRKFSRIFPYQLRHAAGYRWREQFGLDQTSTMMGHSNPRTTLIYAKPNMASSLERQAKVS